MIIKITEEDHAILLLNLRPIPVRQILRTVQILARLLRLPLRPMGLARKLLTPLHSSILRLRLRCQISRSAAACF